MNAMGRLGLWMLAIGLAFGALFLTGVLPRSLMSLTVTPLGLGVVFLAASPLLGLSPEAAARLLATGVPAKATIVDYRPTASRIGGRPIIVMTLRVDDPVTGPREVRHREALLPWHGHRLRRGEVLDVRYDSTKPTRLAVDWDGEVPARRG